MVYESEDVSRVTVRLPKLNMILYMLNAPTTINVSHSHNTFLLNSQQKFAILSSAFVFIYYLYYEEGGDKGVDN